MEEEYNTLFLNDSTYLSSIKDNSTSKIVVESLLSRRKREQNSSFSILNKKKKRTSLNKFPITNKKRRERLKESNNMFLITKAISYRVKNLDNFLFTINIDNRILLIYFIRN
jgi:hypothetical protein